MNRMRKCFLVCGGAVAIAVAVFVSGCQSGKRNNKSWSPDSFSSALSCSLDYRDTSSGERTIATTGNGIGEHSSILAQSDVPDEAFDESEAKGFGSRIARQYGSVGENSFANPYSEPLSTFSLDVSSYGYEVMRRSVDKHQMPAMDSVRLEEYVNSFTYDYPVPSRACPIAVAAEYGVCPWKKTHKLLRLGIRAKSLIKGGKRAPYNLTFLVDVSGAKNGDDRLEFVKSGLKATVDILRLGPDDHVAIVVYDNIGSSVQLASIRGDQKEKIKSAIESLHVDGCSAGGEGLVLALAEVKKNFDENACNRVFDITDSEVDGFEKQFEKKLDCGVWLTIFGVGRTSAFYCSDQKYGKYCIGVGGFGFYCHPEGFSYALFKTLNTVAKNVKLHVEFNPASVRSYRLLGYENRDPMVADLDDEEEYECVITSGQTVTALYEIAPTCDRSEDGEALRYQRHAMKSETLTDPEGEELCVVKFRWREPGVESGKVATFALKQDDITQDKASESFRFASAVAEFALLASDSRYKGNADFDKLIERAKSAIGKDRDGSRNEFIHLAEQARNICRENKK